MRPFFFLACASGCSLVTPLGDLQRAPGDGATGTDAMSSSDGMMPMMDASNDVSLTAYCATHPHVFCSDFDDGSTMWGFDEIPMSGGTSIVKLDFMDSVSKPASLQTSMMMHTASMSEDAMVRKQVPTKNKYHFEADFELCAAPFNGTHILGLLQYTGTDPFRINVSGTGVLTIAVENDNGPTAAYGLGSVTPGWHRVVLDTADSTAMGGSQLKVSIDGTQLVDQKPAVTWAQMETRLVVGMTAQMAIPTCTMHFDNVVLDY